MVNRVQDRHRGCALMHHVTCVVPDNVHDMHFITWHQTWLVKDRIRVCEDEDNYLNNEWTDVVFYINTRKVRRKQK